jgi:hypothetical protein
MVIGTPDDPIGAGLTVITVPAIPVMTVFAAKMAPAIDGFAWSVVHTY